MKKYSLKGFILMLVLLFAVSAFAASRTKTINSAPPAAGTWTSPIMAAGQKTAGFLNISVYGATWSATVTLQRSFDSGTSWFDVTTFTSNSQKALIDRESDVLYRIGVKNGAYSSGSVAVRLSR